MASLAPNSVYTHEHDETMTWQYFLTISYNNKCRTYESLGRSEVVVSENEEIGVLEIVSRIA